MRYHALVDRWPKQTLIYFPDLPGCQVSERTVEAALTAAPTVVAQHLEWLRNHDRAIHTDGVIDIEVIEDLAAKPGGIGARFRSDLDIPSAAYLQSVFEVAAWTLDDLITFYDHADHAKTIQLLDSNSPPMTINGILHHIAEMDLYYLECINQANNLDIPLDPVAALQVTFQRVAQTVQQLSPIDHEQLIVDTNGEEWTTMKLLRRRTGHIREHIPEIKQLMVEAF